MSFNDEGYLTNKYAPLFSGISDDQPAGIERRFVTGVDWTALREARRGDEAGNLAPAGVTSCEPDWQKVRSLCDQALRHHCKDLQVAMWLTEALTAINGFQGMLEGIFVVRELVRQFWDRGLHPVEDEDADPNYDYFDDTSRGGLLRWFDEQLALWAASVPLCPGVGNRSLSVNEYESLVRNVDAARRPYASSKAKSLIEDFNSLQDTLRATDRAVFQGAIDIVQRVREQVQLLVRRITDLGGDLRYSHTLQALAVCEGYLKTWHGEAWAPEPIAVSESSGEFVPEAPSVQPPADPWDRALQALNQHRFAEASDLIEKALAASQTERDRFFLKLELARVLVQRDRYDAAITILELLSEHIEQFHLLEWEGPSVPGRVWKLLLDCYVRSGRHHDKTEELYTKLHRVAPWHAFSA